MKVSLWNYRLPFVCQLPSLASIFAPPQVSDQSLSEGRKRAIVWCQEVLDCATSSLAPAFPEGGLGAGLGPLQGWKEILFLARMPPCPHCLVPPSSTSGNTLETTGTSQRADWMSPEAYLTGLLQGSCSHPHTSFQNQGAGWAGQKPKTQPRGEETLEPLVKEVWEPWKIIPERVVWSAGGHLWGSWGSVNRGKHKVLEGGGNRV